MSLPPSFRPNNRILASLPQEDRHLLRSFMRCEPLAAGRVLSARGKPASDIWFPNSGVVALLVADRDGRTAQAGVVGPEGCVGVEALFSHAPTSIEAVIQIPGEMCGIALGALRAACESRPEVQVAMARFLGTMSAQSLQTIACNRLHSLEARCCLWLLMIRDRTGNEDLQLTQESLATILGSGRPRVNGLLAVLEQDGLIQRYRGRIRLVSRMGLERRACECYRLLRYRAGTVG